MLFVLFAATLSASTPSATATPTRTPAPTPLPSPTGPLTGEWLFGSTNEPKSGPTTLEQPCFGASNVMRIAQSADRVTIDYAVPQPPHGAVFVYEPYAGEHARGTFDGVHLVANGSFDTGYTPNGWALRNDANATPPPDRGTHTPVDYELRLDAKSGHLVGTRTGATFWAVRVSFVPRRFPCPPPPP